MQDLPLLTIWSMDIAKNLYTVHGVYVNVFLERLTTRLYLLRTSPNPSPSTLSHLAIEALLFILAGRRYRAGRGGGAGLGGVFGSRGSSSSRGSTRSTSGSYETHKVFRVVGYVICETDTDFLGVAEVAIQLIGKSVVETIP